LSLAQVSESKPHATHENDDELQIGVLPEHDEPVLPDGKHATQSPDRAPIVFVLHTGVDACDVQSVFNEHARQKKTTPVVSHILLPAVEQSVNDARHG